MFKYFHYAAFFCLRTFVLLFLHYNAHFEHAYRYREWWSSVCQTIFSFCVALFRITLNTPERESETEKNYIEWLQTTLLRKLVNWSSEKKLRTSVTSLRLVPVDRYNELYSTLKDKYGRKFVEVHVLILSNSISKKSNPYFICQLTLNSSLFIFFQIWPEKTDPQKFVYEDVAIATYLLVSFCRMLVWYKVFLFLFYSFEECFFFLQIIWEMQRKEQKSETLQSFVDLGCGNGLLVHILQSEGVSGNL